jgi:hypothetical protein
MEISCEYVFPIFISSTDYNLIDLRAELARYLLDLGYRPILSSSEGFPDNFPDLEPWESCLPVLESCYVMILIIDGRYGTPLDWPHFANYFDERKLSPTHGEYIFAHKQRKRMLVFIRNEILSHYQSYRSALKLANGTVEEARKSLEKTLPPIVEFETLQFIHEVKTIKPIPWIKSFDDVTCMKQEVQKKMLNELAEVFLIKNKHLSTVVHAFSRVTDGLPEEKRKEILQSIGVTRELIEAIEIQTRTIQGLKEQENKLKAELEAAGVDIEKGKKTQEEKNVLEDKIVKLIEDRKKLERRIAELEQAKTSFIIGEKALTLSGTPGLSGIFSGSSSGYSGYSGLVTNPRCDACGKLDIGVIPTLRTCPQCQRKLCNSCWPEILDFGKAIRMCPECERGLRPG